MPENSNKGSGPQQDEVFDRQYNVYKESLEQRGLSEEEAEALTKEKLETATGEPAGAHSDRE